MTTAPVRIRVGEPRRFMPGALQPFALRTRTGRLIVTAQMPVPLGTRFPGLWATMVSDDDGESWRPAPDNSPFHEGCATPLRDGTILVLPWSAHGPDADGWWTSDRWESRDNFASVSLAGKARFHLPQAKPGCDDGGDPVDEIFLHRSLLELPGGDLLLTSYCWFVGDDTPSTYKPTMNKFRTVLLRSADRGRTWSLVSTIARDPSVGEEGFNEPVMARLTHGPRAGRLVVLLRTGSNKTYRHNPIHQCVSEDEGRTWSRPAPLPLAGNVDPDLIEMDNGVLACSFGYRTFESRQGPENQPRRLGTGHGNYLALSFDGGDTWSHQTQVTDEPSTCYTALFQTGPGRLLLIYDVGDGWHLSWADHPDRGRGLGCRRIDL